MICSWYEFSKPENTALIPFAINTIETINTEDSKPPRWVLSIFSKIFIKKKSEVLGGKNEFKNFKDSLILTKNSQKGTIENITSMPVYEFLYSMQ